MDLGVSSDVRGEIWVLSSLQQLTSSSLQFSSSHFGFDGTNLFWSFSYLLHFLPSLEVGIPQDLFWACFLLYTISGPHIQVKDFQIPLHLTCPNIYHDPQICNFSLDFSPRQQSYISSCLQDVATWLAHKYLKHSMSPTELIMLLLCLCAW